MMAQMIACSRVIVWAVQWPHDESFISNTLCQENQPEFQLLFETIKLVNSLISRRRLLWMLSRDRNLKYG